MSDKMFCEKDGDPVEVYPAWDDEYLKNIRIDENYLKGIILQSRGKLSFPTKYWKMSPAIFRYSSSQTPREMSTTLSIPQGLILIMMLRLRLRESN